MRWRAYGRLGAWVLAATIAGGAVAAPEAGSSAAGIALARTETLDRLIADAPKAHPVAMYLLAKRLFDAGRRDEAVFWFYVGQLRWRAMLTDHPNDGEVDQFNRLHDTFGPDINFYAACDLATLQAMYGKVLDWDAAHPSPFASAAADAKQRTGMKDLEAFMREHEAQIRKAHEGSAVCAPLSAGSDPYAGNGGAMFATPPELITAYDPSRFRPFKTGKTTKAEVVGVLGRPDLWYTDKQGVTQMSYSFARAEPGLTTVLGMTRTVIVSFTFDAQKTLTKIELPKEGGG